MFLERMLALEIATRFSGLLSISGTDSDEDPTGAAGDSDFEDDDLPDDDEDDTGEDTDVRASDDDERGAPASDDDEHEATAKRKHRFSDHDSAEEGFRELQGHASRLEAENARLRQSSQSSRADATPQASPFEVNEAQLTQIGEAVNAEYLKLPKEQQNLASATRIMMKHVAELTVKAGRTAAQAQQSEIEARNEATINAKRELTAIGLDPDKHWDLMIMQRDLLDRADPTLLRSMQPQDQFKELARRTRDYLRSLGAHTKAEVKQAKDDLNREAGGSMAGGSRRSTSRQPADGQDQGDEKQDSMTNDLRDNRAGLRRRSTTQYNLLTRSGSVLNRR